MSTHEEDEDSLFGSPPTSPGRPSSPPLALPSGSMYTQNVGTIALPGSHPNSELPMNPLVLSLNHGIVQRPPAPPPTGPCITRVQTPVAGPSHCRSASGSSVAKPKKKQKVPTRSEQPEKPTGPEFALPDPSGPPPVHFLRNQQNLLGKAGMIAGVKPATITHIRGSTPSNPILIDEEDSTAPTLGRRAASREKSQPYIDPALLTAPTNQEIVSVLIGQKDIFPILEGVLKLIMGNTPGGAATEQRPTIPTVQHRTGFERTNTFNFHSHFNPPNPPPVKKRKLNRVPAGATDWDVPYPFQQGEGPEAYHKTWERERGKRLISELIKLIKTAARKAATKKYLAEQKAKQQLAEAKEQEAKINGYYRPETTYGNEVLHDTSNMPALSLNSEPDPTVTAAFDQLITSLENIPPHPPEPVTIPPQAPVAQTDTGVDQPLFDTWMNFLESFPVNFDDMNSLPSTSQCPTPAPALSDLDFVNMLNTGGDGSSATSDFDAMMTSMFQGTDNGVYPPITDQNIDPTLCAGTDLSVLSITAPSLATTTTTQPPSMGMGNLDVSPAPGASPPASGSSVGGSTTPGTPVSAAWEMSTPGIFTGGAGEGQAWNMGDNAGVLDFGLLPEGLEREDEAQPGKGKARALDVESPVTATTTTEAVLDAVAAPPAPADPYASLFQSQKKLYDALATVRANAENGIPLALARQKRKDDILHRAQEEKRRIQSELDKVKMRLWGSTIEQAALVTLLRRVGSVEKAATEPVPVVGIDSGPREECGET